MMEKTFTWKAEVEFHGTMAQYNELAKSLNSLPVRVRIPRWPIPLPYPGLIRVSKEQLQEIGELVVTPARAEKVPFAEIQGINGGIREAHMHMGDVIVFLEKANFQKLLKETVSTLAVDLADVTADYVEVADVLQPIQDAVRR